MSTKFITMVLLYLSYDREDIGDQSPWRRGGGDNEDETMLRKLKKKKRSKNKG